MNPSAVQGDHEHKHHFEGWTQSTLAAHLVHENELHDSVVFSPTFVELRYYKLDELEWHHYRMHASRMRELSQADPKLFNEALKVLHS